MLHDDRRTGDYLAALAEAVRPGDVVLDIGTGSGVLAVAAARAGARRVYAVEASDIAEVAERVFAANGVQDRVTLVPGWSRQIELPEPADLLVAEIIGNEPLEEEILETTLDARRRLLKPEARLIPHALTLLARPLAAPGRRGQAARDRARRRSSAGDGCTASSSSRCSTPPPGPGQHADRGRGRRPGGRPSGPGRPRRRWTSPPSRRPRCDAAADLVVDEPGTVNAVAVTFRADLHGAIAHTLDPWTWPTSSWATSVWVLPGPVARRAAGTLRVHYAAGRRERPTGSPAIRRARD